MGGLILVFCLWCFFTFARFSPRSLDRLLWTFATWMGNWFNFINWVQKFGGTLPPKKCWGQNMQNFRRFSTASDFDREYLRNGARYQKSERHTISSDSSHIRRKRSSELWSTIYKEFHVSLDPLKETFWEDYIYALRWCCLFKFFIWARDWTRLPSAHPNWDGGPPKNLNGKNLKFDLKFSVLARITSGLVGISSQNFSIRCAARQGS